METETSIYEDILRIVQATDRTIIWKYNELYQLFNELLRQETSQSHLDFSGPFARMDFLCKKIAYARESYKQINSFRARSRDLSSIPTQKLEQIFKYDVKYLSEFVSAVTESSIPLSLQVLFPQEKMTFVSHTEEKKSYVRLIVDHWDDTHLYGTTCDEASDTLCVAYKYTNFFGDWSYLGDLLRKHAQLNLIHPWEEEGIVYPELIIFEPDYLLDISAIASCFESYGHSPLNYLINKIKPAANSAAILLGNFASQLLDETLYSTKNQIPYQTSIQSFFRRNALSIATCPDLKQDFHQQALSQKTTLEHMCREKFPEVSGIRLDRIILEPSFISEMLGIQGRMDLLQEDMRVLMEQKSGKRAYRTNKHVEKHYVQVLLYLALLHYNYGLRNEEVSCFLLYSKYEDGLIKEGPAPELLFQAFRLRNEIVHLEQLYTQGEAGKILRQIQPEDLNLSQEKGVLWERYTRPQLEELLHTIQSANPLEQAYFDRFFTFLAKEHLLAKIGNSKKEGSGFATIWNANLHEKKQTGDIYDELEILSKEADKQGTAGISKITLAVPEQEENFQPNFRAGDIAMLYAYKKGEEPDARRTMIFRCTLIDVQGQQITVKLRAPQRNASLFEKTPEYRWAIEHDFIESTATTLYRGLYAFLQATPERRALLLNQRPPRVDSSLRLSGEYSQEGRSLEFNEMVLKAKQAQDYFLLIGPPGTGKTSFGLVNILKEALLEPNTSVLLLSYTNRAVDEICSKLVKHQIDFLRVGNEVSCEEIYQPYLLGNRAGDCRNVNEVKQLIISTRVLVGTTTALTANLSLFSLKPFTLAIVDEASQILEPHLLALLSVKYKSKDAIQKFILIGDHKQLPAVVSQSEEESAVTDKILNDIELLNCRQSLFERLLRLQQPHDALYFCMEKQGRMHPKVSDFPNSAFYEKRLRPVPLVHQEQELDYTQFTDKGLESILAQQRVAFLAVPQPTDYTSLKANQPEALLIAKIVHTLWQLYQKNGKLFDPYQTLGIIVPYRNQIAMIRHELEHYKLKELQNITIDTVERYQGSERDIIIYGFTVQRLYQLNFLTENVFEEAGNLIDRKLNVALTRAREQIILVGNPQLLSANPLFSHLLDLIRNSGNYYKNFD